MGRGTIFTHLNIPIFIPDSEQLNFFMETIKGTHLSSMSHSHTGSKINMKTKICSILTLKIDFFYYCCHCCWLKLELWNESLPLKVTTTTTTKSKSLGEDLKKIERKRTYTLHYTNILLAIKRRHTVINMDFVIIRTIA